MNIEPEVRELSETELSAVSGAMPIVTLFGHTLTTGDVASAASWAWRHFWG